MNMFLPSRGIDTLAGMSTIFPGPDLIQCLQLTIYNVEKIKIIQMINATLFSAHPLQLRAFCRKDKLVS